MPAKMDLSGMCCNNHDIDETKRQNLCALRINFHEITYREGFNPREGFNLIRKRYVND